MPGKKMRSKKGKDGYSYPYTITDIVLDANGNNLTDSLKNMNDSILDLEESSVDFVEDGNSIDTSVEEYKDLTTENKTIIGSINEINSKTIILEKDELSVKEVSEVGEHLEVEYTLSTGWSIMNNENFSIKNTNQDQVIMQGLLTKSSDIISNEVIFKIDSYYSPKQNIIIPAVVFDDNNTKIENTFIKLKTNGEIIIGINNSIPSSGCRNISICINYNISM